MEHSYAQAIWKAIAGGKTPKQAVATVVEILTRDGRIELLPRIMRALKRLSEREMNSRPRVYVAHEKDAKSAFKESGVSEADVCVDETLIGGWRLENAETLIDTSFKKQLLSIYSSVTR